MDVVHCLAGERLLTVFDSAAQLRERDARYSFVTADPVDTIRFDRVEFGATPFSKLRQWQSCLPQTGKAPPFCGGIAGLISYDIGQAFEVVPQPQRDVFQTPALLAGLFDWSIVWDHLESTVHLYALRLKDSADNAQQKQRRRWVHDVLRRKPHATKAENHKDGKSTDLTGHRLPTEAGVYSCFSREDYETAVERVIEYIRAGDIFQANLAQQMTAEWDRGAIELYERVLQENPAPFCGMMQADDFAIVSASPERFLKVDQHRRVETRPIKGTRRRQKSPIADLYTGTELAASEKDRAENVMIVDLLRNDLSRVCKPGSVKVTGLCEIEVFETVQHLVSTVIGELQDGKDMWDLCAAAMPGGSITGAPKIRAMQIIAEIEPVVRGAYCGNLFYCGPDGNFDSNILIRTFTLKDGIVQFPVGGGIVADSDSADEYQETLHKAAGMIGALRSTDRSE